MYYKNINNSDKFDLIETFLLFFCNFLSLSEKALFKGSIMELFKPLLVIQHINKLIFSS